VAPPDLPTTVDTLAHRLRGYTLPAALTASLFRHYAAADFPRAENYLWEWEDESGVKSAAGVAFYESLRKLDDAALAVGGFTRAEVEKGYADFVASTQQA
jgi:hypothetical protein